MLQYSNLSLSVDFDNLFTEVKKKYIIIIQYMVSFQSNHLRFTFASN